MHTEHLTVVTVSERPPFSAAQSFFPVAQQNPTQSTGSLASIASPHGNATWGGGGTVGRRCLTLKLVRAATSALRFDQRRRGNSGSLYSQKTGRIVRFDKAVVLKHSVLTVIRTCSPVNVRVFVRLSNRR
jgi:hypothetical protein